MKIVSFHQSLPITDPDSFLDLTAEKPRPRQRDLLVEIKAIGINPVDAKIRAGGGPGSPSGDLKILGWDAAGVVREVRAEVSRFSPGDEVFYAGAVDRPGCYAEFQCVDERIVGHRPKRVGFAESAAMPLTTITAWEMLFDRLKVYRSGAGSLLIVGGAGGVGSIATQLARQLTNLEVICTASRPETRDWCRFTRSRFETPDMGEQGRLLDEVARLIDDGRVHSTMQSNLGTIDAANMKRAHEIVESGRAIGKIALEGF